MNVSVIIPVYNTERYVATAIDSVLAQTRPAAEIIVVDDESTDGTLAVLRSFGARIVVLRQPHAGAAAAINAALPHSRGDLIAFLDADDLWDADKLRQQCDLLAHAPDIEAVFSMARQFISPDAVQHCHDIVIPAQDQAGLHKGTMLIRRAAFERIGSFDASLQATEFIEWFGRATALGLRTHMLPTTLMHRRIHASNTGRLHRHAQRDESLLSLKRKLDLRRARTAT